MSFFLFFHRVFHEPLEEKNTTLQGSRHPRLWFAWFAWFAWLPSWDTRTTIVRFSAGDPTDLEDLLRGALVPWVRQKLEGNAPVEVCRWLLVVVAKHDRPAVVLAAEEALLELLAEGNRVRLNERRNDE